MKKKLMSAFLATVLTLSFVAGGLASGTKVYAAEEVKETKETVELTRPSKEEGYTIGISVLNLTGQFFIQLVEAAQEECDATGCELMTNSCDSDSAKQITALENFISAGCDAIIVCAVDAEASAPVIAKAKEAGIAVICLTSTIEGYDAYIGCEEYVLGYTQGCAVGQRIVEMYGTEEEVQAATLNYDLMETVIDRKKGIMEGVQEYAPNVKFVADATAGDQEEGMSNTENFLQANPDLKVVCGVSDGAALGAYQAFKAAGMTDPEKYLIAGIDATDEALKLIGEESIYQVTVSQNPSSTGKDLVDTAIAVVNKTSYPKDSYFDLQPVTSENVSEYIK